MPPRPRIGQVGIPAWYDAGASPGCARFRARASFVESSAPAEGAMAVHDHQGAGRFHRSIEEPSREGRSKRGPHAWHSHHFARLPQASAGRVPPLAWTLTGSPRPLETEGSTVPHSVSMRSADNVRQAPPCWLRTETEN
jgi:hypothetical protein